MGRTPRSAHFSQISRAWAAGEDRGSPDVSPPRGTSESAWLPRRWHLQEKGRHRTPPVVESFSETEIQPTAKHPLPPDLPKMGAGAFASPPASLPHHETARWLSLASFLDRVSSRALSLPFPGPALGTSVLFFCCIFIFISFPVYKIAVIGAANQGCLGAKHAATCRWALCDPGTAMLILFFFCVEKIISLQN